MPVTTRHFYIAKVEIKTTGEDLIFMVHPGLVLKPDTRTEEQITDYAVSQGYEISHCDLLTHGVDWNTRNHIEGAVLAKLREMGKPVVGTRDFLVELPVRILKVLP